MGRLAGVAPLLVTLLAAAVTNSAAQPAPGSAQQGTNASDVNALYVLRSTLSLTTPQIQQLRWGRTGDPCGNASCAIGSCAWNGIACSDWRVTGIDISPAVVNATPTLLGGRLPDQLANLSALQTLNASLHSIAGTLPAAWGALSSLRSLDLSSNGISGGLPADWAGMTSIQTMNLSSNSLQGAVPQQWQQLSSLQTLNVSSNRVCQPASLAPSTLVVNENAASCSTRLLADSPLSAPAAAAALGTPPPPPPALPPPGSGPPTATSGATQSPPILQMSTGINIAVSVVIGAFLLFGIVAGAFRVRRQQAAHTAWLRARADAMRRQEREDEEAFQQYLRRLVPPKLAIAPDRLEISLAAPCNDRETGGGSPPRGGGSPSSGGGGFAATANSPDAAQRSPPMGVGPGPIAAGTAGDRVFAQQDGDWFRFRPVPRTRKLPLFIIDAHFAEDGGLDFGAAETVIDGPAPAADAEAPAEPEEASSRPAGLRGLWTNIRSGSGREAASLEVEAGRRGSASQPHSLAASRAPSAAALGQQPQDPSVAARVRERIEQLQEGRPGAGAEAAGPAPPPPFISWAPLRRALRLESVEAREARLRAQAAEAGRAEGRAERAASATAGRPSTSARP